MTIHFKYIFIFILLLHGCAPSMTVLLNKEAPFKPTFQLNCDRPIGGCYLSSFENGEWTSKNWSFTILPGDQPSKIKEIVYGETPAGYTEHYRARDLRSNILYVIDCFTIDRKIAKRVFIISQNNGEFSIKQGQRHDIINFQPQ